MDKCDATLALNAVSPTWSRWRPLHQPTLWWHWTVQDVDSVEWHAVGWRAFRREREGASNFPLTIARIGHLQQ